MDGSSVVNKAKASMSLNLCNYYCHVENRLLKTVNTNNTIVKFTKLPEHDFDAKAMTKVHTRKVESRPFSAKTQRGPDGNLTPSNMSSRLSASKYYYIPDSEPTVKSCTSNSGKNVNTKTFPQVAKVNISNKSTRVKALPSKIHMSKEKGIEKYQDIKNNSLHSKQSSSLNKNTTRSNISLLKEGNMERKRSNISSHNLNYKHVPIIKVPLEKSIKSIVDTDNKLNISQVDTSTEMEKSDNHKDIGVGTEQKPETVDVIIGPDYEQVRKHSVVQTEKFFTSNYDSLIIPNVTLLNDKENESKEDLVKLSNTSLPLLQVPELEINPEKNTENSISGKKYESKSYIIGRATLTYTTKQEIDFHIVSNTDTDNIIHTEEVSSTSSRPLAYPMNIVSLYKEKIDKRKADKILTEDNTKTRIKKVNTKEKKNGNALDSINYTYVHNRSKLVKPSELISTMRLNNGLLQNDCSSEQFQRELKFIDSFYESLQYLENCSMSNKSFTDTSIKYWVSKSGFDVKSPEYGSLFSMSETDANIDDAETMASKSLCLLNLLIRDEQRRVKNFLFVLKMREDALKDFTKSQILWLENRKKDENIDIPTLKKKQRGALLKLQHECGEMQRMRKALLALSEKRKVALLKTKKNIELKLKKNVIVQQMSLEKRNLKRSLTCERSALPLKCFDLSSSGCEDIIPQPKSETAIVALNSEMAPIDLTTKSTEKSIQTKEISLNSSQVDEPTEMAAYNLTTVDGGYLNILFHNLSLPEIFSSGKKYEVNENALRSVVDSTNNRNSSSSNEIVDRFIDQMKNHDLDRSTTPSTARSLVEEFDQYYKGLVEEYQSPTASPERSQTSCVDIEIQSVQSTIWDGADVCQILKNSATQISSDLSCSIAPVNNDVKNSKVIQVEVTKEAMTVGTQADPFPVPAKAASETEANSGLHTPPFVQAKSSCGSESSSSLTSMSAPLISLVLPVHNEAEELRRQQLAIEQEIKALEQQQGQLLVIREIPNKPPPPYIPPADTRVPKPSRTFAVDDSVTQKVESILTDPSTVNFDPTDEFCVYLQDFCQEAVEKYKKDQGDKPWDACNLLQQNSELTREELVKSTSGALKEILECVPTVHVPNAGIRRSDHIDDILFAEWRCCEPQWTAHHNYEANVKNQIFEGIFQNILTDTINKYKKIVLESCPASKSD